MKALELVLPLVGVLIGIAAGPWFSQSYERRRLQADALRAMNRLGKLARNQGPLDELVEAGADFLDACHIAGM